MIDEKSSVEETHESPVDETLESEGFSETEDALKGADVKSGHGEGGEERSGQATSGATEQNPNVEGPEGTP